MSGIRPFFITGARAKIKLNGKTLAFCTDLSYSVQIITQTPKILGMYEGSSVEPLGYSVTGSFTIIRYAKDAAAAIGGNRPNGVALNDAGNGVGNWGSVWGNGLFNGAAASLGLGNDGRANEALDPSRFSQGTTFDIQVYQKVPGKAPQNNSLLDQVAGGIQSVADVLGGEKVGGFSTATSEVIGVANIRNCRITQADFELTKRGVAVQRFNFVALYVDEDSFVADFSGLGHHFQG
ncbi:MAG: hypothetical protein QXG63_04510 [Nitrososphaerales archaeon]